MIWSIAQFSSLKDTILILPWRCYVLRSGVRLSLVQTTFVLLVRLPFPQTGSRLALSSWARTSEGTNCPWVALSPRGEKFSHLLPLGRELRRQSPGTHRPGLKKHGEDFPRSLVQPEWPTNTAQIVEQTCPLLHSLPRWPERIFWARLLGYGSLTPLDNPIREIDFFPRQKMWKTLPRTRQDSSPGYSQLPRLNSALIRLKLSTTDRHNFCYQTSIQKIISVPRTKRLNYAATARGRGRDITGGSLYRFRWRDGGWWGVGRLFWPTGKRGSTAHLSTEAADPK